MSYRLAGLPAASMLLVASVVSPNEAVMKVHVHLKPYASSWRGCVEATTQLEARMELSGDSKPMPRTLHFSSTQPYAAMPRRRTQRTWLKIKYGLWSNPRPVAECSNDYLQLQTTKCANVTIGLKLVQSPPREGSAAGHNLRA